MPKISQLTTTTTSDINPEADFVAVVDTSAATTKKLLVSDLVAAGLSGVCELAANGEIDGNLTRNFEFNDIATLTLDATNLNLSGVAAASLTSTGAGAGQGEVEIRADQQLTILTPAVVAQTAAVGEVLKLTDPINGVVEFGRQVFTAVDSVAALKAITVAHVPDGSLIQTRGYYTAGDGGHGLYRYSSSSALTQNGGTVIAPTSGSGRYLLQVSGDFNIRQFGAVGDGSADDRNPIQAACNAANAAGGGNVIFPAGNFRLVGGYAVVIGTNVNLIGKGGKIWVSLPTGYTNPLNWSTPETYSLPNQLKSDGTTATINVTSTCPAPWNGKGDVFTLGVNSTIRDLAVDGGWGTTGAPAGVVTIRGMLPSNNTTYPSAEEPTFYRLFSYCSNSQFIGCKFSNVPGTVIGSGAVVSITNCQFGDYGDHVTYYAETTTDIRIANNYLECTRAASGTVLQADYVFATYRDAFKFRCCKRFSLTGNTANIANADFVTLQTLASLANATDLENGVVSGNLVKCVNFALVNTVRSASDLIQAGCIVKNVRISNNAITCTGRLLKSGYAYVAPVAYRGNSVNQGFACNNFAFGPGNTVVYNPTGTGTQPMQICGNPDFSTPWVNFEITGNTFNGTTSISGGFQWFDLQGVTTDLIVRGNKFYSNKGVLAFVQTTNNQQQVEHPRTNIEVCENSGFNLVAWMRDALPTAWDPAATYNYGTIAYPDGFTRILRQMVSFGGLIYVNNATVTGGANPDVNASWTLYTRPKCNLKVCGNNQVATVDYLSGLEARTLLDFNGAQLQNTYNLTVDGNVKTTTTGAAVSYNLGAFDGTWTDTAAITVTGSNTRYGTRAGSAITTGVDNTVIGANAAPIATTGSRNTIIGEDAALASTTGNDSTVLGAGAAKAQAGSVSNTVIGSKAAQANTSGTGNTVVGQDAALNTTSLNYNVVVGAEAGQQLASAGGVLIGYQAGKVATNGDRNVIVGYQAGISVTTADDCVLVGSNAGRLITTGTQNTMIGSLAGYNQTGQTNCLIGYGAAFTATSGNGIIAIGVNALGSGASLGNNIIAIGPNTMMSVTGTNNIGIGSACGSNLTTGINNILIGANSNVDANRAGCIVIGGNAVTLASITEPHLVLGSSSLPLATAATATAGSNGDVPAQVSTYLDLAINGTRYKIPLYNA